MKKTNEFTKKVLFSVKWRFLPQQKKYAILWERTLKSLSQTNQDTEHTESLVGS